MIESKDKYVQDILINEDFINYVFNPTHLLIERWDVFFKTHPDKIPIANEARLILLGRQNKMILPVNESLELKARIFEKCGLIPIN